MSLAAAVADARVPKMYRRLVLKRAKLMAEDFNYRNYNATPFSGVDFCHGNAYVCPFLLALHHEAALRRRVAAHLCHREFCLACEMGFLGAMLHQAAGHVPVSVRSSSSTLPPPCPALLKAGNLLRALRAMKEAAGLGLLVGEEEATGDLHQRIQAFARFFVNRLFAVCPPFRVQTHVQQGVESGCGLRT